MCREDRSYRFDAVCADLTLSGGIIEDVSKQIERLYVTLTMLKLSSTGRLTVFMQKALQRIQN